MRSDKSYDSYERKVNDILTLLGDIGGLQGSLFIFGFVIVGLFASKYFMSKIVKKIYQIRKYENLVQDKEKSAAMNTQNMKQAASSLINLKNKGNWFDNGKMH